MYLNIVNIILSVAAVAIGLLVCALWPTKIRVIKRFVKRFNTDQRLPEWDWKDSTLTSCNVKFLNAGSDNVCTLEISCRRDLREFDLLKIVPFFLIEFDLVKKDGTEITCQRIGYQGKKNFDWYVSSYDGNGEIWLASHDRPCVAMIGVPNKDLTFCLKRLVLIAGHFSLASYALELFRGEVTAEMNRLRSSISSPALEDLRYYSEKFPDLFVSWTDPTFAHCRDYLREAETHKQNA